MNKFPLLWALALGLLTTPTVFGQSRFSFAPTVGYDVLTSNVEARASYQQPSGFVQTITFASQSAGFHAGLTTHYAFSAKWSASIGVQYSRLTGSTRVTNFYSDTVAVDYTYANQRSERLQVPVLINYTGSGRRLSPYLSGGVLFNYNYQAGGQLDFRDAVRTNAMIGVGVLYLATARVSLIVQPTLQYQFSNPASSFITYPTARVIQVGLQTQVKFSF